MQFSLLRHRFAFLVVLIVAVLVVGGCGGSDDDGSAVSQDRLVDPEITDPDLSVELGVPEYDPATIEAAGLGFLPELEAACVGERVGEGMAIDSPATLNGCLSAQSISTILEGDGLAVSAQESLCIFDSRVLFEEASLEAETTADSLLLIDALERDTINCMTDSTVSDRVLVLFPNVEMTTDEARCALQAEFMDTDDEVFGVAGWCGIAGRALVGDGLGLSVEGTACVDELSQAALPQTPAELPDLASECASADDLAVLTAAYG